MTTKTHEVPLELPVSLLANHKKPEDLIGENGLLKQLTQLLQVASMSSAPLASDDTASLLFRHSVRYRDHPHGAAARDQTEAVPDRAMTWCFRVAKARDVGMVLVVAAQQQALGG
jgi:hypothetical protein